ncbi:DUF5592 family protein [Bacillus pumilus]|uniref:DUF5592 family protein n=1 Tax=Bacillus pumilus TaxID=1408 RepID=UPI003D73C3AA
MRYRIPNEINSELKLTSALFLFDLFFLIGVLGFTSLCSNFVHAKLSIPFYVFMLIVGVISIIRTPLNPKKRMYEALFLALIRDRNIYTSIDREN